MQECGQFHMWHELLPLAKLDYLGHSLDFDHSIIIKMGKKSTTVKVLQ